MPQLDEILKQRKNKSFIKKEYRPWDLSGTETNKEQEIAQSVTSNSQEQLPGNLTPNEALPNQSTNSSIRQEEKDINKVPKRQQIDIRKESNNSQIDIKKETIGHRLDIGKVTYSNQLDTNIDTADYIDAIKKLNGLQEKIFYYVVETCAARGLLETGILLTNDIISVAGCSYGTAKIAIKRLIDKGLINRMPGKRARGGHIVLSITKGIRSAAMEAKRDRLLTSTIHQQVTEVIKHLDINIDNKSQIPIYSSNSYINNTTTSALPEDWKNIDTEILQPIGFSETQLRQLYSKKLNTPEIIQESINHFAFGLIHNPKVKAYAEPLNVLMGVLRQGGAWVEKDYQSPQEIAQREFIERKKAELEKMKKLEETTYDLALNEWKEQLTKDELEAIAPSKKVPNDIPQSVKLSIFFKTNVWPERKKSYFMNS